MAFTSNATMGASLAVPRSVPRRTHIACTAMRTAANNERPTVRSSLTWPPPPGQSRRRDGWTLLGAPSHPWVRPTAAATSSVGVGSSWESAIQAYYTVPSSSMTKAARLAGLMSPMAGLLPSTPNPSASAIGVAAHGKWRAGGTDERVYDVGLVAGKADRLDAVELGQAVAGVFAPLVRRDGAECELVGDDESVRSGQVGEVPLPGSFAVTQ